MRLKFTYQRPSGESTDLVAELDATATVGQLAHHLARSDPRAPRGISVVGATLEVMGQGGRVLGPGELVAESELASGVSVKLVRAEGPASDAHVDDGPAVQVTVRSGPDRGRSFLLRPGSALIGRDAACEVRLTDSMVSRRHARLVIGETVEVVDQGSANGVTVGRGLAPQATLSSGDVIGVGNTELEVVQLTRSSRRSGTVAFVRPARVTGVYEGREFEAPVAPERRAAQRFPTIALIAPLVMGAVLYLVTRHVASLAFVLLSPLMLIGSSVESRLVARRDFRDAVAAFDADLAALTVEVRRELEVEVAARLAENPGVEACVEAATGRGPLLWSRRPDQPDFGVLRLGVGRARSRSSVVVPARGKAPHEQVQKLEAAVADLQHVDGVPVTADLTASAVGVVGPRPAQLATARALVAQAVTLHSPAELVVAGLFSTVSAADWDWLKWLPHTSSRHSPLHARHLAGSQAVTTTLVSELESLLDARAEDDSDRLPRVLLLVETDALVEHNRLVALAEHGPARGVHVLWLAPDRTLLPASCRVFAEAAEGSGRVGDALVGVEVEPVELTSLAAAPAEALARSLAPVDDTGARTIDDSDLPRMVSQLTILGDRSLGTQPGAVVERWQENGSILTGPYAPAEPPRRAGNLRAVIGQAAGGPHALDLRRDGPHALVGGTTNSGKSELLQAWILALAASHSPERVTFLLVDYKGGSAFSDCVQLPHTIGLVTDLNTHLVRRALTSLSAELRYREELLRDHGAKDLIELERHGVAGAPPSLVIVVDEFAALVNEVPEFVEGVVNVAQRGRSLGLHLVLATQQPSGVIKGSLRANTNLRISLRTADVEDSQDIVGAPDAASFDPMVPGRAMSRSGPRRLVPFQAAYAGGWTSEQPEPSDIEVEVLSLTYPVRWELPVSEAPVTKDRDQTDIKRLVRTIRAASDQARLPVPRKPWLPVLPQEVDLLALPRTAGDDRLVFARGDVPEDQAQPPVSFRPDREGNLVVYGTGGSGKSTLLRSLALAAGLTGPGGPCRVYGLDFGSRALAMLEDLPHVGSIVMGADHERVTRLLTWLRSVVDERAARYAAAAAGTITDYRRLTGRPDEPRILLLLDGVGAFRQAYETTDRIRFVEMLTSIASEGRPVGVHLALAAAERTALHTALASAVQRRVVLRMASDDDYSLLGVSGDVLDVHSPAGRGLDSGREIQVGILGSDPSEAAQVGRIVDLADRLRAAGVPTAPPIRSLPDRVHLDDLGESREEVRVGLDSGTLAAVGVDARGGFLVTGPPGSGRSTALRTLVASASRSLGPDVEMHYIGNRRSELASLPHWASVSTNVEEATRAAQAIAQQVAERVSGRSRVVVVVESAGDLVASAAEPALQALVKLCIAEDHWFVAEGEVSTVKTTVGYLGLVKSSRRGLALQPDVESGTALFNTPFPRINRGEFPEGRGFLVGSGRAGVVQVATSGPLDDELARTGDRRLPESV